MIDEDMIKKLDDFLEQYPEGLPNNDTEDILGVPIAQCWLYLHLRITGQLDDDGVIAWRETDDV